MLSKKFAVAVGGKEMSAEFTDLAEQAHGSVLLRYCGTVVMATALMGEKTRDDIDYFPLTVEYEERFYAAGKILGSRYVRREGRPSEDAILSGRIVDRTIRPLFDWSTRNEVQVIITVLALGEGDPSMMAVIAASLALTTSNIPWNGPVASVRIGKKVGGEAVVNPERAFFEEGGAASGDTPHLNPLPVRGEEATRATLYDLLVCGQDGTVNMIEAGAQEVMEDEIAGALGQAVEVHNTIIAWQKQIISEIGKPKRALNVPGTPEVLAQLFETEFAARLTAAIFSDVAGKATIGALQKEFGARVAELVKTDPAFAALPKGSANKLFDEKVDEELHRGAIEDGRRADGRRFDQVRELFAQAGGVSDILHGSGIFYRGGTHVFSALTLGGPGDSQLIDSMEEQGALRRFMHHYNFPPYSVGETGRVGGLNRRMIGHGALAEKALLAVLPEKSAFPYTIRVVSECFASNGSTSMGSVCASTLALMDGGVPIKAPVAGIAMGLMMSPNFATDGKYKVLTDIQGPEDHHGDMDFKVAGTKDGITAIQMDIKLAGVPVPVLVEALAGAKAARLHILETITAALPAPRPKISSRAPEIIAMSVRPEQIGLVIGSGGKTINGIKEVTGVTDITIEDDGSVFITGTGGTAQKAREMIEAVVKEYKAGEVYEGEVTRLMDFGAFVKIGPTKEAEGLVHVSEVAPFRIDKIGDAVAVGDKVRVMIKEVDEKGRLNLSIKAIDPDFATRKGLTPSTASAPSPRSNYGDRPRPQGDRPR